jgi:hypothetical protein
LTPEYLFLGNHHQPPLAQLLFTCQRAESRLRIPALAGTLIRSLRRDEKL